MSKNKVIKNKFKNYLNDNYIYILSFVLPFLISCAGMILCGCAPFGQKSIFSGDGIHIDLPSLHASVRRANILTPVKLFYSLLPETVIDTAVAMYVVIMISLCGPSLIFYLTHRLNGKKADKKDFRLLFASMTYCLCSYMVLMVNYNSWYIAFFFLPIILLGMDKLIVENKPLLYLFILGLCLYKQYYITVFICFYLVFNFFTYDFESFKDFIIKGIKFTLASLSMLLLNCNTLYSTISQISGSTYNTMSDSINSADTVSSFWPVSKFFHSWWYYLNQQRLFADSYTISWHDGDANLYFGILPCFLLLIFIFSKEYSIKQKIKKLLPLAILFFSLNQSIANFIINGLHLQNGIPNRFSFLLALSAAIIGYESICILEKQPAIKTIIAGIICILLWILAQCFEKSIKELLSKSIVVSIIFMVLYIILALALITKKEQSNVILKIILVLFCLELCINSSDCIRRFSLSTGMIYYDEEAINYLKQNFNISFSPENTAIHDPICQNFAVMNDVKTNQIFSAGSMTPYQFNMAKYLGNTYSINMLSNRYSQTIIGNSLGCNRYILVSDLANSEQCGDYDLYDLIYEKNNHYIFKNNYVFPYVYYLPSSITSNKYVSTTNYNFWKALSESVLLDSDIVLTCFPLQNKDSLLETSDYIDYEKESFYQNIIDDSGRNVLKCDIIAPDSGYIYINTSDFQYLGYHNKGDKITTDIDTTDLNGDSYKKAFAIVVIHQEGFLRLYNEISKYGMNITNYTKDSLDGTITLPEDGLINFTIPYSEDWKVYIDDQESDTFALADAFLCTNASKGTHNIHAERITHVNYVPIWIQRISWIILLICIAVHLYKKRRFTQIPSESPEIISNSN